MEQDAVSDRGHIDCFKHVDYHIDKMMAQQLEFIYNDLRDDFHCILIIDGMVGSGKSTLAQQLAYALDPKFDVSRVCFSPIDFIDTCKSTTEKYRAVVWDEAITGASSTSTMTRTNKAVSQMINQIRQKNMVIILCIPSFYDLQRDIAAYHSTALINVYIKQDFERKKKVRGLYSFYNYKVKNNMYCNDSLRKYRRCPNKYANFSAKFTKKKTVDEAQYNRKKSQIFTMLEKNRLSDSDFIRECYHRDVPKDVIVEAVTCTKRNVDLVIQQERKKEESI